MLTVNIKNGGSESIFEVSEVNAHTGKVGGLIDVVNVTLLDGGIRVIERCDVYVMSNGKTVAKYMMTTAEIPKVVEGQETGETREETY